MADALIKNEALLRPKKDVAGVPCATKSQDPSHYMTSLKKYIEHGQNVKMHFSITLDISSIFVKYLVYIFVSTCFVMQKCQKSNSLETESKN